MNLTLTRNQYRSDGVFSTLTDENGNVVARTLDHAYDDGNGGWTAKIQPGTYTCQLGPHELEGMTAPFQTFEVLNVPDFQGAPVSGILFHWGNYAKDSHGCLLLGASEVFDGTEEMVTNSRATFAQFMTLQAGIDQFTLTVVG